MRRFVLAILALAWPCVAFAYDSGFNITWGEGCYTEAPMPLTTVACDTNTGYAGAVVSFSLPYPMDTFRGVAVFMWGMSPTTDLPDWWQLVNPGSCRSTSLTFSTDFSAAPKVACQDPWQGPTTTSAIYWTRLFLPPFPIIPPDPNHLVLRFAAFYSDSRTSPLASGQEWYGMRFRLDYQKTAGAEACAGCSTPVTLTVSNVDVYYFASNRWLLSYPISNASLCWQGAPGGYCFDPTPVANRTWGQVKSLYR